MRHPVRFDSETHTYWRGQDRLLGASEALQRLGFCPAQAFYTAGGRTRGNTAHLDTADHDIGRALAGATTSPWARSWQGWLHGFVANWDAVESPLCDPVRRIAGTPDRVGRLDADRAVVDLKSGVGEPWHRVQAAIYGHLAEANGYGPITALYTVYLHADGSPAHAKYYDPRTWIPRALAVVSAAHVHAMLYPEWRT